MKFYISYLLIPLMLLTGCKFDEIKSVSTTGELNISVDENVEPLMKAEISEFERLNPEAKVNAKFIPTNNAVADLINSDTKLIVIARNLTDEEKGLLQKNKLEVNDYPIAIDAIGFIVNVNNPVTRVTSEDLKNIFTGTYQSWTNIKSQDEKQNADVKNFFTGTRDKIKLFIQRKNSSTHNYVLDSVLKKAQYASSAVVCSTSVQMLNSVRDNESAIGIITMNWLSLGKQDTIDTTVKTLRISKVRDGGVQDDFSEFHQGNIYNGKYPYRRTINVFTTDVGIQLSTGFITFLTKTDGQKIVLKQSLVPVTQPVRTIQIN